MKCHLPATIIEDMMQKRFCYVATTETVEFDYLILYTAVRSMVFRDLCLADFIQNWLCLLHYIYLYYLLYY